LKKLSRAKLFIENFLAYGAVNVINKIIPLLLLPVITRLLTDPSDFGVYDMYNLIIGFASPLAMLGIYDALFREYFEKENQKYRYNVTSTANRIIMLTSIVICFILILFNKTFSRLFFGTSIYGIIVIFSAIEIVFLSNKEIIAAPTRIQNKRKVYVFSGIIESLTYYVLAIFLIYMGFSYFGMIYANIIASLVMLTLFWMLNKDFFTNGKYDKDIARELFRIGIPLLPTFLIYWVFHSMDKLMITNMLGTVELGIYSVGARVASVSSLIYAAFAGGWQYFAFSTMRDEDYKHMMGKIWEALFVISSCFFVMVFLFKDIAFNILFVGDYRKGVIVFPYLLFAPFLQMLYQVLGTQFQIIKKTYYSPVMLSLGVIVNLFLNYILIPSMGIKGAAIATLLGFVVIVGVAIIIVVCIKKLVCFKIKTYIMLLIFSGVFIILNCFGVSVLTVGIGISYLSLCVLLYYKEVLILFRKGEKG
jgi:O-antigen/teichoic acid export membrane protein